MANAPKTLVPFPRMGERLTEFAPREVHRLVIAGYEIRYELAEPEIRVLQIFHGKQDR